MKHAATFLLATCLACSPPARAEQTIHFPAEESLISFSIPDDWKTRVKGGSLYVFSPDGEAVFVEVSFMDAGLDEDAAALKEAKSTVSGDFKGLKLTASDPVETKGLTFSLLGGEGVDDSGPAHINLALIKHPAADSQILFSLIALKEQAGQHGAACGAMLESIHAFGEASAMKPKDGGAEAPAFVFDEQPYFLRESQGSLREYLTEGETFEKWSTLISTREVEGIDDPSAYAFKMVNNAKAAAPNNNGQVIANKEDGIYFADFLMLPPEGSDETFAEWNMIRITQTDTGIHQLQYARRFYDFTAETAKVINGDRQKILGLLAQFEIPDETAAMEMQTFTHPDAENPNFAVSFPAAWEMKKTARGAYCESPDKQLAMNVFIVETAEVGEEEAALKEQVGKRFKEVLWNDGKEPEVAGGDDAGLTSFTHKAMASDGEGTRQYILFLVSYVKKQGDQSIILLCQCPVDVFEKYGDTLQVVVKSVQMRL